ncbi:uncharacterized protein PV09_01700 [Verruconis gallopava]|uniref:Uncharacterized protein n=1 Tax=Verruconis gallopava TaxID=253628 RepID=A0A0D2B944_9PEZI|nr:uncharacterized protein PV09_01700 [Verruconis gallopava]KIW07774.1 hypothetical protein PV09_01700 [Verruconis gallopava]
MKEGTVGKTGTLPRTDDDDDDDDDDKGNGKRLRYNAKTAIPIRPATPAGTFWLSARPAPLARLAVADAEAKTTEEEGGLALSAVVEAASGTDVSGVTVALGPSGPCAETRGAALRAA